MNFAVFGPFEGLLVLGYIAVVLAALLWFVRSVNRFVAAQEQMAHSLQEVVRALASDHRGEKS